MIQLGVDAHIKRWHLLQRPTASLANSRNKFKKDIFPITFQRM
jgi:hypothetical protein